MPFTSGKYGKKRLEILRSAAAAFRRHGYHGASMDSIAHALDMTKGNLYYYFKDKEEILFVCHDYSLDILLDRLKEAESGPFVPEQLLHKLIVAFVHMMIDELHGTTLTLDIHALSPRRLRTIIGKRDKFDHGIRRIVEAGIDAGVFRKGDPKLITFAILGAMNWIPRWFDPSGPSRSEEISHAFADYLIAGLLTNQGVQQQTAYRLEAPDSGRSEVFPGSLAAAAGGNGNA
jgi:AcrR family transcriptional regulator